VSFEGSDLVGDIGVGSIIQVGSDPRSRHRRQRKFNRRVSERRASRRSRSRHISRFISFRGFDTSFPDYYRFKEWEREFDTNYANGNVAGPLRLGVEGVGQDMEEAFGQGAEGGARYFVGPTASVQLLGERLTIVGGPSVGLSASSPRGPNRVRTPTPTTQGYVTPNSNLENPIDAVDPPKSTLKCLFSPAYGPQ
jgi:hypothetical protein